MRLIKVHSRSRLPPIAGMWWTREDTRDISWGALNRPAGVLRQYRHIQESLDRMYSGEETWNADATYGDYDEEDGASEERDWYGITWVREWERNEFGVVLP